jgi:hypothetical protein
LSDLRKFNIGVSSLGATAAAVGFVVEWCKC